MEGRGNRLRSKWVQLLARIQTKHSAHGRRRIHGPYASILSLMEILLACLANALRLFCKQRASRLEPAASVNSLLYSITKPTPLRWSSSALFWLSIPPVMGFAR